MAKNQFEDRLKFITDESFKDASINVNDSLETAICMMQQSFGVDTVCEKEVIELTKLILNENARLKSGK